MGATSRAPAPRGNAAHRLHRRTAAGAAAAGQEVLIGPERIPHLLGAWTSRRAATYPTATHFRACGATGRADRMMED